MTFKHSLIMWLSGALTSLIIIGIFWTVFRTELDAARSLVIKADATFEELRRHWDERQIVEITATAALFNSFNRFNSALGVDLTVYPKNLA